MDIRYTALSETGLVRNENQDCLFCGAEGNVGIFIVSDGMGGHQDGAHASMAIIEKAKAWWERYLCAQSRPTFFEVIEELKEAFLEADQEIYQNTEKGAICGATLVALWLDGDAWAVFSCGDSRCYQARGKRLKKRFIQLTTDDVWENQEENVRDMSEEQIKANKNYGCLVKAIGVKPGSYCSVQSDRCQGEVLFLLCSDGIYRYCPKEILKKWSFSALWSGGLEDAAQGIQECVFNNGAGDNLSLILVLAGERSFIR